MNATEQAPGERYRIRVVDKVFEILESFEPSARELTLQEIVDRTGQTKSGAYRLLANLQLLSIVERDPLTRRYRIGTKLYALGSLASVDVRRLALKYMEQLGREFGCTANLSLLEGSEMVLVEVLDGPGPFRMSSALGSREPLYCTGSGKCILAFTAARERDMLLDSIEFVGHTPNTLRTRAQLLAELELVRQKGYALDNGEYEAHGRCVAAPLFDRRGQVCAAMSVSGPETLLSKEQLPLLLAAITRAAAGLSRELGCVEAYPVLPE